jgi:choline kinase
MKKLLTIILAAGMSSRMKDGKTKCIKKINSEETIIQRMLNQQQQMFNSQMIYISTGYQSQEYESLNSSSVKTVNNSLYETDKNINSCFLCLEKAFLEQRDFDFIMIVEGDVIISDEDAEIIKKQINKLDTKNTVFVEKISANNKNRIGCVSSSGNCYLRNKESLDDRMTGIFLIENKLAKNLLEKQKNLISNKGVGYYYFYPFLINDECKVNFNKVYLNKSFTINNQEEYKWAKKNL